MLSVARYRDLMVSAVSGEHKHHARRGAEVRFRDAAIDEADRAVKLQRVGIGGDLQALSPRARKISAMRLTSAVAIPRLKVRCPAPSGLRIL